MPEFKSLQQQITEIRNQSESDKKTVFQTKERLKKIELSKKNIKRTKGEDSEKFRTLLSQERALNARISRQESQLATNLEEKAALFEEFQSFDDPRENMGKLSDEFPILLFPVRLETRFKKTGEDTGDLQHQLWVRIYPDECSVDTFDDTMSESELKQVQNYWVSIWKAGTAGGDEIKSYVRDKEIGAWKKLMGRFKAGRSYWLTENYVPINNDEIPVRDDESTVILIITTEDMPDPALRDALKQYWSDILLARDNTETADMAFDDLTNTLGIIDEAAAQLLEEYRPQNIKQEREELPKEETPDVTVAFLHFPAFEDTDTKLTDWSQAATVTTFPEKFVLLGFQDGSSDPVIDEVGQRIPDPLIVGPDSRDDITALLRDVHGEEFDELSDDEKAVKYVEYLSGQADTKWLFNFDEAVDMGLGFKVNLTEEQYEQGFDRLFVLGIKISTDQEQGKIELEQLIHNHHLGDSGFSILPQGTPTNNTEDEGSGYSEMDDAEEAYDRYHSTPDEDEIEEKDPHERSRKRDGRWLAELLGIDIEDSSLNLVENYYHTDQREAAAMNTALWNATIGYYMESMITPVSSEWERELTRWFLINYVRGRGKVPSVRIGDQPYGILPISTMNDLKWLDQRETSFHQAYSDHMPVLQKMYSIVKEVREDWEELLRQVAYIGKEGEDAHDILLKALGLHATSVEFDRRIAESFTSIINKLKMQGILGDEIDNLAETYRARGLQFLEDLGYEHDEKEDLGIPILEKSFFSVREDVEKPLIDDNPLSEGDPIRAYTEAGQNYIDWLIENAREDHRKIKNQDGFVDNKRPDALLYDMLRHALNLEFGNTGLNLFKDAQIINNEDAAFARIDADFIDIETDKLELQSKWDLIYRQEDSIADNTPIVDHISELLRRDGVTPQSRQLQEVIAALEQLKDVPTARLERCFVEHLDCCSYRLDAWLLGFLHLQLNAMRYGSESNDEDAKEGIYLGAYGFVENLRSEDKTLSDAELDPELREIFDPDGSNDITEDNTNAGYIHAPSINHGLTAAVLRNAYISTASEDENEIYKVNLSSERVRLALGIIEGIQQGQSLGALLGYQLERGLHDNNDEELNVYIYELRKVFPLSANRNKSTEIEEDNEDFEGDKAISKIEARNVLDGLSLLNHIRESGDETYPFGFPIGDGSGKLKAASGAEADAINEGVQRIMNIRDAVADVGMAESVHQVVQGNYDRAAGALDAFSKGEYPQLPDVIQSPGSGVSLTHRFGIHLPSGIAPSSGTNPRDIAEPAVNAWLADIFPSLSDIRCAVTYQVPDYEDDGVEPATIEEEVSMQQLGLVPIDLLYMLTVESEKNLTSLDEYLLRHIHQNFTPRPDAKIEINYTQPIEGKVTFFELASVISNLRSLIVSSRPLQSTDISLPNEAREEQNVSASIDPARLTLVKQSMENILQNVKDDVIDILEPLIDDESLEITISNKTQILNQFDDLSDLFITYFSQLGKFGISGTGFGYVYDRKSAVYRSVYQTVLEYKKRWDDKMTQYTDLIDNQLPTASSDEERIKILLRAERVISTQYTAIVTSVSDLQTDVENKKNDFDTKYTSLETFLSTSHLNILDLFNAVNGLKTDLQLYDHRTLETEDDEKQVIILTEDMYKQAVKLHESKVDDTDSILTNVQNLLDEAAVTDIAGDKIKALTDAAKAMLGEDFLLVPEFMLGQEQGEELQNSLGDQEQLLDYQMNGQSNDFPVDDWLYGVARVREKLTAWESLVMMAEGVKGRDPLNLTPVQFPYTEDDSWLGLSYPPDLMIESDKLLYTAYIPDFDPVQPQCGLMVDEWTEIIPAKDETSGMTFHYDRPNNEPPQTMLMVTPSAFTGEWSWGEIVESLHETLEMAKLRAIEPDQIDQREYAKFLPATVATLTYHPVTMFMNYGIKTNN